jgi:hypothetical protein
MHNFKPNLHIQGQIMQILKRIEQILIENDHLPEADFADSKSKSNRSRPLSQAKISTPSQINPIKKAKPFDSASL